MPLPMHNRRPRPAGAASRDGTALRQHQHPHINYTTAARSVNGKIDASASTRDKEGIVQRLQRVLVDVRRDRDREHRLCDIAQEKLRGTKEAFRDEQSTFEEDKEKLTQTQTESTKTQEEILRIEARLQELQQKYRFQHEDLVRKREKIQQQNGALEAAALRRDKSILAVRQRLDQQRDKYQQLERKHDREPKWLLKAIVLDARARHHNAVSAPRQHTTTTTADSADTEEERGKQEGSNTGDFNFDFDQHQEVLEKKQEEALTREFKTIVDYATLPKMILQKAKTLKMESETLKAEVTRLEDFAIPQQGPPANANYPYSHYQQEHQQLCDTGATTGAGTVGTDTSSMGASIDTAMMDDGVEGTIKRKNDSRTILESTMDTTESNLGNNTVEGIERKNSQTILQNENTAMDTQSFHLGSNGVEGKDRNIDRPTAALENPMYTTESSNPVEGWNDGTGSLGIVLESQNTMDIELHLDNEFEGKGANISQTDSATDLGTTMNIEPHPVDGDDSAATTLETNADIIEPGLGIRARGNEYREVSPTTTLESTATNVVKPHPGNGNVGEHRTQDYIRPLWKKISVSEEQPIERIS